MNITYQFYGPFTLKYDFVLGFHVKKEKYIVITERQLSAISASEIGRVKEPLFDQDRHLNSGLSSFI